MLQLKLILIRTFFNCIGQVAKDMISHNGRGVKFKPLMPPIMLVEEDFLNLEVDLLLQLVLHYCYGTWRTYMQFPKDPNDIWGRLPLSS
jgi:hypothetical protein